MAKEVTLTMRNGNTSSEGKIYPKLNDQSISGGKNPTIKPAPLSALFRFVGKFDIALFAVSIFLSIMASATMPGINIIFGDVVDAIAKPINVNELVGTASRNMALLGVYGFVTFFSSFATAGYFASRVANSFRTQYLEGLLRQDMTFFDQAEQGSLTLMLSDSAMDIQSGIGDKFASMIQGLFQMIFGFGIAFYFGPMLALVLMACAPVIIAITTGLVFWGSEDGMYGKEAYEKASSIAAEALSNIRTVASLNAETKMSERYDSHLVDSEKASIKQSTRASFLMGSLFFVMFCMYGLGFWYGAVLISKSWQAAITNNPAPSDFLDPGPESTWALHYQQILVLCAPYLENNEALEICACGLPWETFDSALYPSPKCGCSAETSNEFGFSVLTGCLSGGRTLMVFFSILIGGFAAGQIGPGIKAFGDARIAAAKMLAVIDRQPDIDINDNSGKELLIGDVTGEITLENMHFQYQAMNDGEKGKVVFGGCNLTMKAGQTIALVGESGCGKSTIAKLVERFYDPTGGRILLDGCDLRDIRLTDLRKCIGVVNQEPLLFDISIKENIRYGKPSATDDDVIEAAKSANAHEFISNFPEGYDTPVGQRGSKLSGGQKQRVAIARAILRNPPILILDEATSALDNKSEKIVQQALDRLVENNKNSRTTIVIAHRLSTVRNADKIVVLGSPEGTSTAISGSVILEEGNHDELMRLTNSFYKALVIAGGESRQRNGGIVKNNENVADIEVDATMNGLSKDNEQFEKNTEIAKTAPTFWEKIVGKKSPEQVAKEKLEKETKSSNKKLAWSYTMPEMPLIVFGSCASIIKGAILPLLSLVFAEMFVVWYNSDLDEMREKSLRYSFMFYSLALAALVTETVQKAVFETVGERLTKRLRSDLFRAILSKDISWFENSENSMGRLTSHLSTDVKLVRLVTGQSVASTLESCSSLTTGIIIAAWASWEVFLIMLAMVPLLGTTEAMNWYALKGSEGGIRKELTNSTNKLHETIGAIREVQAFSLEHVVIDDIEKRIRETIMPASRKAAVLKGVMMGMIQLVQFSVYAFAFWFGGKMIDSGRNNFADFNRALWAMAFAASGLGQAALFAGDAAKASAAINSIAKTLKETTRIMGEPWENGGIADKKSGAVAVRALSDSTVANGQGNLSKVNFAYPTRKAAKVFNQINLSIPAGKVVAIVGSSGSGKSTVIQMLMRYYDPVSYKETKQGDGFDIKVVIDDGKLDSSSGLVSIDAKDVRETDIRWLRRNMGYVGQEPVLFNDTIYNNIALGKESCTKEEIEKAARQANAYDFIMKMEDGFNTNVGLAGSKVSGGQKQRIAIARALIGDPKILLLDEATSALDNESEKVVQASLDKIIKESGGDRTTIIVAHRLSTIMNADVICVLDNDGDGSEVAEMGTHDELIAKGGKYHALVQAFEGN